MKVNLNLALATVSIVAAGAILWKAVSAGKSVAAAAGDVIEGVKETAGAVIQAVNPTSPTNIFYQGANAATRAATGQNIDTFGTWLGGLFDASGSVAVAPSVTRAQVINIADYFETVDRDDADMAPAPGFLDSAFITNAGGAATGRARMKR